MNFFFILRTNLERRAKKTIGLFFSDMQFAPYTKTFSDIVSCRGCFSLFFLTRLTLFFEFILLCIL